MKWNNEINKSNQFLLEIFKFISFSKINYNIMNHYYSILKYSK